jgi:hypothetical protein
MFQPLREQARALAIMPEDLQEITPAAAENEDVPTERIPLQNLLDLQGEAVHPTPHVGMAGGEPDPGGRGQRDHRTGSPRGLPRGVGRRRDVITAATAAVTAAGSTVPLIRTRTPPDSAISIEPVTPNLNTAFC